MLEMTIIQLQDELRRHRMKMTGTRAELIKRLRVMMIVEEQDDDLSDDDNGEDNEIRKSKDEMETGHQDSRQHHGYHCLLTFKDIDDSIGTFDKENH